MKTRALATLAALSLVAASRLGAATPDGWHEHAADAFSEAAKQGRYVLVDLYADWCTWCKVMEKEVFPTPAFQAYSNKLVLLRVNVEDRGEGAELQRRFGVQSLPTLLLLDAKRARIGSIPGFLRVERLLPQLDAEIQKYQMLVEGSRRALAGNDAAAWLRYGKEFHQRNDGAHAAPLFAKLAEASHDDKDRRWYRLGVADSDFLAGDNAAARKELDDLAKLPGYAADAALGERVDLLRFLLVRQEGDCSAASAALASFVHEHPTSALLDEARRSLSTLHKPEGGLCS